MTLKITGEAFAADGTTAAVTNSLTLAVRTAEDELLADGTTAGQDNVGDLSGAEDITGGAGYANGYVKMSSASAYSLAGTKVAELTGEAAGAKSTISDVDVSTAYGAQNAISVIDAAIAAIDAQRSDLGAVQNRFDNTINNLQNIAENASAARSRIMDTDYAAETANLSKNQVLQQAGTAILAQAKQLPQAVLSLLQ